MMVTAALVMGWTGAVSAQHVGFRLPEDDPNTNSDVIRSAAFSPDGSLLAVGYGRFTGMLQEPRPGQAVLWDARSGGRKLAIPGQVDGVCSVTFSPDGKTLAVTEYPGVVRLWDVEGGRERLTIKAPAWTPGSVAFSPDGRLLATGLWTGTKDGVSPPGNDVVVWDVATGKSALTLKGHTEGVHVVAFSPNGRLIASGGWDGVVKVWDASRGLIRATLEFPALHKRLGPAEPVVPVVAVAFSPDGRILVTSAGVLLARGRPEGVGEVTIWSAGSDRELATLKGYDGLAKEVIFSPDGKLLATAGSDGMVRLWATTTLRQVGEIHGGIPIAFSPDGRELVASDSDRTLTIRKVADAIHR
jgi:WD40 repeat protein